VRCAGRAGVLWFGSMPCRWPAVASLGCVSVVLAACSAADPGPEPTVANQLRFSREVEARHDRIRAYFREREGEGRVASTQTPGGVWIDWLAKNADLPPAPPLPTADDSSPSGARRLATELQRTPAARGPAGTVPRVRFDVEAYLNRTGAAAPDDPSLVILDTAPPSAGFDLDALLALPASPLRSGRRALFGSLDLTQLVEEQPLARRSVWIARGSPSRRQSIAVGVTPSQPPALFVYYTTSGGRRAGDWLGGFDQRQAGFCQVSETVVPGDRLLGDQAEPGEASLPVGIQIFEGRWWVFAAGEWVGFYPRCQNAGCGTASATCTDEHPFLFSRHGLRHRAWEGFGVVRASD
jgi:hypothetical protein